MPETSGFSHLALTVSDVGRSRDFYTQVFDLQPAVDDDAIFIGMNGQTGLMFGLRRHEGGAKEPFTHLNAGLDHASFAVDSKEELEKWEARLQEIGATYTPIEKSQFGWHLNFRDPDNIPLEFFVLEMG